MSWSGDSLGWKASKVLESLKQRPDLALACQMPRAQLTGIEGMMVAGLQCLHASI